MNVMFSNISICTPLLKIMLKQSRAPNEPEPGKCGLPHPWLCCLFTLFSSSKAAAGEAEENSLYTRLSNASQLD